MTGAQFFDLMQGYNILQVANASRFPTIEDVLNVRGAASTILSHLELSRNEKKELRRTSKAFKHAIDSTITRFDNYCYGFDNETIAKLLDVLLGAPWDLESIVYDFSQVHPPLTDSVARHLDRWKNLQDLSIQRPQPDDICLLGSCNLERLTSLRMQHFQFDANSIERVSTATWLQRLRKLEIYVYPGEAQNTRELCLKVAPFLATLEYLKVCGWNEKQFGTGLFSCSGGFPNLRSIEYIDMGDADATDLGQLQLPKLEELSIRNVVELSIRMTSVKTTIEGIYKCKAPLLKSLALLGIFNSLDMKLLGTATWANTLTSLDLKGVVSLHLSTEGTFEFRALKELTISPYYQPKHGEFDREDSLKVLSKARLPELTYLSMLNTYRPLMLEEYATPCDVSSLVDTPWCCQLQRFGVDLFANELSKLVELVRHGAFENLRDFTVYAAVHDHLDDFFEDGLSLLISAGRGRFRSLTSLKFNSLNEESKFTNIWSQTLYDAWTEVA